MDETLHERETESLLRLTRTISDCVPFEERPPARSTT